MTASGASRRNVLKSAALLPLYACLGGAARPLTPTRAADFLDSMGVNVHVEYTDGGYASADRVMSSLRFLGIQHVRDAAPYSHNQGQGNYDTLAAAGFRFTMMVNREQEDNLPRVSALARRHPGSVVAIEGPNEVNNWPVSFGGRTGVAGAQAYQTALIRAVRADPALSRLPVYNFTTWPDAFGEATHANFHSYPKKGQQPFGTLRTDMERQVRVVPDKPVVLTEVGYFSDVRGGPDGVDEATQAIYLLNTYLDAWSLGVQRTFVYELLDAYPDPQGTTAGKHYGLFDLLYRPKPAASAIRNLRAQIRGGGAADRTFKPAPLEIELSGLPSTARSLLMQQGPGGGYVLVLWNEADIWDARLQKPRALAPVTVDLRLPGARTVSVSDPVLGRRIVPRGPVRALPIALGAVPLVVAISPR